MNMARLWLTLASALIYTGIVAASASGELIFPDVDKGWFQDTGRHISSNENTLTGRLNYTEFYRTFFLFDLTSLAETPTNAKLRLSIKGTASPDGIESFTLYDYVGDTATLGVSQSSGSTTGKAVYSDLGSGAVYGLGTVGSSDVGTIMDVELGASALADISAAAGGMFAVGVRIDDPGYSGRYPPSEYVLFSQNATDGTTHDLVLNYADPVVPEPSTMALLLLGSAGLCVYGFRRERTW